MDYFDLLNSGRLLKADLYRYNANTSFKAFLRSYFTVPAFRYTYHLRRVTALAPRKKSWVIFFYGMHRILLNRYRFKYGFEISPSAKIGGGLYLGHFGRIGVNPGAVLGENINLSPGVSIGATNRGPRKGTPTLEDRVWVGTNCNIVGRITIGHDALIAPGAYVNFDVPPMAVVLGNPGKIVSGKGSAGYVNNMLDVAETKRAREEQPTLATA
ncbi:MAG: hypothetical protein FWD64_05065 [Acidobacteriaceae bacterium]|nr:hypothetical protein [Acidobacteriaceae bacterium]